MTQVLKINEFSNIAYSLVKISKETSEKIKSISKPYIVSIPKEDDILINENVEKIIAYLKLMLEHKIDLPKLKHFKINTTNISASLKTMTLIESFNFLMEEDVEFYVELIEL
jgi:hypothetical protein